MAGIPLIRRPAMSSITVKNTIKTVVGFILASVAIISTQGCRLNEYQPEAATPFEIVVLSDIHLRLPGYPDDVYFDNQRNLANVLLSVDLINETYAHADFVAVTGDLVGCLFSENPDDYLTGGDNPPEKFRHIFNHLVLPYYTTLGNHDYHIGFDPVSREHIPARSAESVEAVWKKVLDVDPYYSFIHKGIQMIFLNSNRGDSLFVPCNDSGMEPLCMGSFDAQQMDWLEDRLRRPEPAILFCHHPPVKNMDTVGSFIEDALFSSGMSIDINDRFYDIAATHKDKIIAVFSGHWHMWREYTLFDTIKVYQTGPVGDYWSSGENMAIVKIDPVRKTVDVNRHQ
jgi:3',5'-cyclic AMP phosphodiesterase CpdA